MSNTTTIKEALENKYGDLSSLIEAINSNDVDSVVLPAGMTVLEFWELSNELEKRQDSEEVRKRYEIKN